MGPPSLRVQMPDGSSPNKNKNKNNNSSRNSTDATYL